MSLGVVPLWSPSVREELLAHSVAKHVGSELSKGTSGGGGLCPETVDGRNDVCYHAWASHPTLSTQVFEYQVKVTGTLTTIALKERYEKSRPIALSRIAVKRESDRTVVREFDFQPAATSWQDRVLKADLEFHDELAEIQLRLSAFEYYPFGGGYTSHLHVAMIQLQGDETTVFEALPQVSRR